MGSSNKKTKETTRKRRHHSPTEDRETHREKKHKHHRKHHKDRRRDRPQDSDSDSDVVEVIEDVPGNTTPPPPRDSSPTEPFTSSKSKESLSIEQTNRLRAKLGLKPLQVDDSSNSSSNKKDVKDKGHKSDGKKKDEWGEFYHKPAQNLAAKASSEKIKSKLHEFKEKQRIETKLGKVATLGEDSDGDDLTSWVDKSRKIEQQKKEAEKRAKMLEELDEQFGIGEIVESEFRNQRNEKYSNSNLKGLRVDHEAENFEEGETIVLTLKDQVVLAEDEDVLVNVNMVDDERYAKSNLNKKKQPQYQPLDDEEFDDYGNPKIKSLLGKYDEEIEGAKQSSFRIGQDYSKERKESALRSIKEKLANKRLESLEMPSLTIASDYFTEEEINAKFKKTKKKVRKIRNKVKTEDPYGKPLKPEIDTDDIPEIKPGLEKMELVEENDDDLANALHKARKIKQKENLTIPEIKSDAVKEEIDSGNITLNATAEFCRTLGDIPTYGKSGNRDEAEDLLDFEKEAEDVDMDDLQEVEEAGRWNAVDLNRAAPQQATTSVVVEVPILEEEPDVGSGVGAALKLAMSKGYLEKPEDRRPSNRNMAHLMAQHYSIEDKSYGDDERGNRRERYSGPITDFRERDGFKPNVKLEYIDDEGHILNAKEAFRYLSHKFHGKGPGKNKVEKRLKKSQQEGLMKKMSSTDTPLSTLNMLQAKQKETQSPFVVLSGGKHVTSTTTTTIAKSRR